MTDWPYSYVDRVRFGDLDAMRHLNNVAFLGFFESARIAFMGAAFPDHRPTAPDDFGLIFAECHVNYRAPAFFDEEIRTFIRPADVRRSSFRVYFEMRAEGDGRLLAEGWGALVGYDYAAERPAALPDRIKARLAEYGAEVVGVSVDWAAAGLLDGVETDAAREARRALLDDLHDDGVGVDELRRAVAEDRLALLPVERILAPDGERFSAVQLAERTGVSLEFLSGLRTALGLARAEDDDAVWTEEDRHAIELQRQLEAAGYPERDRLEVARVLGYAMAQVAQVIRDVNGRVMSRPGDTERDRGLRYAEAARASVPLLGPVLEHVLSLHLRQQLTQEAVSAADLAAGGMAGARPVGVGFADLVGFTRLGEEIPPENLGAVAGRLTELAGDVVRPPVRIVKFIGDAAMLLAPREPEAVLAAALDLVDAAEREGREFPRLRAGVAAGDAIARGGDWYGRPVNVASRLTQMARPASVLATEAMKEAGGEEDYRWSFAGRRNVRGVRGEVPVYRVRRAEPDAAEER